MPDLSDSARLPSGKTIFLSYSRADQAKATKLAAILEKRGYTVWWDSKLEGGSAFADSIGDALNESDAILVLWSKHSITSDWVRDEATVGRDRKRLVPLSLDGSEPPLGFRQYHAVDLSHWRGRADCPEIRAIERSVDAIVSGGHPVHAESDRAISRRSLIAVGGGSAIIVAGGGATWAWRQGWFGGSDSDTNSIAVLPFKSLGGGDSQSYLSDGITEEIRSRLKRLSAVQVLAATSSAMIADGPGSPAAQAVKLGIAYLLEGTVQRLGDRLKIGADLTDSKTGFSVWSDQIDRSMSDIFAVQEEIADNVARGISAKMATASPEVGGTKNLAAYDAYLRGREKYLASTSETDDRAALALFDLAIASDPDFAKAHAFRSRNLTWLAGSSTKAEDIAGVAKQALDAAHRAVKLAPMLPDAQLAVASAHEAILNLREAEPFFQRAYQLGQGDAEIVRRCAVHMMNMGDFSGAQSAVTKAISLDPLNPLVFLTAGLVEYHTHDFPAALGLLKQSAEKNPEAGFVNLYIALSHLLLGDPKQALEWGEKEPTPYLRHMALAIIRRKTGDISGAKREFDTLVDGLGDAGAYQQAEVLAQWGELGGAFDALDRAIAVRDVGLTNIKVDPLLDPIRVDPRFKAILGRLKLD